LAKVKAIQNPKSHPQHPEAELVTARVRNFFDEPFPEQVRDQAVNSSDVKLQVVTQFRKRISRLLPLRQKLQYVQRLD